MSSMIEEAAVCGSEFSPLCFPSGLGIRREGRRMWVERNTSGRGLAIQALTVMFLMRLDALGGSVFSFGS